MNRADIATDALTNYYNDTRTLFNGARLLFPFSLCSIGSCAVNRTQSYDFPFFQKAPLELFRVRGRINTSCRTGGIGRRDGFKIHCPRGRLGSSPRFGTVSSSCKLELFCFLRAWKLVENKYSCRRGGAFFSRVGYNVVEYSTKRVVRRAFFVRCVPKDTF